MNRLSASAVPRALACPTSLVLPQQDYRTAYADAGSDRHAEMEDAADRGAHDELPEAVRSLIRPGDRLASEISFAYDASTGEARTLGHVRDRQYGALGPFEITGTIDLLIVGNGRIIVVDYKGFEEVTHAEDNAQLATYALMAARTYGYQEVTVVVVYLVANRKPTIAVLDHDDLRFHDGVLRSLQVRVAAAAKSPEAHAVIGRHCRYCPAFLSCAKQKALAIDVQTGIVPLRVESMMPLDDDEKANDALELTAILGTLKKRLDAAIYARAHERPIQLRNGKLFGPRTVNGNEKIDADIAYEVVRAKYGQAIADTAVERKATKKKLREALAFVAGKGKVAATEREALALIDERGGIEKTTKTVVEEYDQQEVLKLIG